jgi:fatty-acyl-CoA synthase
MGHPAIAEATVIGVHHPKWDERPLLLAVRRDGEDVSRDELLAYFEGRIAKWWQPDDCVFVDELPHTATGKLDKKVVRDEYRDYRLPTA